jgi:hypothetical protein
MSSRAVPDAWSAEVQSRLVHVIKRGLRRAEPTANVVRQAGGESLFDGSYDWHSNLMAHWVLLTHARLEGDQELARWVLEPLSDGALLHEQQRLRSVDTAHLSTFPYDQAWLLMLLAELGRHRELAREVQEFQLEVETRLIDWLTEASFPENDNPAVLDGRRIIGWYRSWAFTWYQVRRAGPCGTNALERLDRLRRERVDPIRSSLLEVVDPFPFEFLWVPTLAYLIDDLEAFEPPLAPYDLGDLPPLPEEVDLSTTHLLGVHISRLWPLAIASRSEGALRTRLHEQLALYLEREDLWDGDFKVVSHWIPQYLWIALWLAGKER